MSRCCEINPLAGGHAIEEVTVTIDPQAAVTRDLVLLVFLVAAIMLVVITAAAL